MPAPPGSCMCNSMIHSLQTETLEKHREEAEGLVVLRERACVYTFLCCVRKLRCPAGWPRLSV